MIFDGRLTLSPSGVLVSLWEEELNQTALIFFLAALGLVF